MKTIFYLLLLGGIVAFYLHHEGIIADYKNKLQAFEDGNRADRLRREAEERKRIEEERRKSKEERLKVEKKLKLDYYHSVAAALVTLGEINVSLSNNLDSEARKLKNCMKKAVARKRVLSSRDEQWCEQVLSRINGHLMRLPNRNNSKYRTRYNTFVSWYAVRKTALNDFYRNYRPSTSSSRRSNRR